MTKTFEYGVKICKTTGKKKLASSQIKNYDQGTIRVRKPKLSEHIEKKGKSKSQY